MDASWLWRSEELSDVRIRLRCSAHELDNETARPAKRTCRRTRAAVSGTPNAAETGSISSQTAAAGINQADAGYWELPAHSTVLASVSGYWKARTLRWKQDSQNVSNPISAPTTPAQRLVLEETVDTAEELQAAQHVLCHGYTQQLPTDLSMAMLIQMAVLADRWDMPGVVAACLQKAASQPQLSVEELNIVLDSNLPETVRAVADSEPVQQACAAQLLRLFGRAWQVMASTSMLQSFCRLSLQAVQLWASQDKLQVDSENTIAVLFTHWWGKNSASMDKQSQTHAASTLTEVLRACHLCSTFITCVLDELPWFLADKKAVQALRMQHAHERIADDIVQAMPAAWTGVPHAQHSDQVFELSWQVTRADLDQLHKDAATVKAALSSDPVYWCGYWWQLALEMADQKADLFLGIDFDLALPPTEKAVQFYLNASWDLTVETSQQVYIDAHVNNDEDPLEYDAYCGSGTFLEVFESEAPRAHSYPPDYLWHSDGKLHLGLVIKTVS